MSRMEPRTPRLRRELTFIALTGVLGLSALGLSQCRLMDDTVTGVNLKSNGSYSTSRGECEKDCNEAFKDCLKAEDKLNKSRLRECDELSEPQRSACRTAEAARHTAAEQACTELKLACKRACGYREGSGDGGR
jgi:hypothetical protein